jgi:hypothetical protein
MIDVYRVSAYVPVIVPTAFVALVVILGVCLVVGVVVVSIVIGVIVVTTVIAVVVITAVPGRIAVVCPAVIDDSGTVPAAVPTAVSPAATTTTHHGPDRDPGTESNYAGGSDVASAIPRGHIGCAINHCRVVLGDIDHLGVGRLNDDDLW